MDMNMLIKWRCQQNMYEHIVCKGGFQRNNMSILVIGSYQQNIYEQNQSDEVINRNIYVHIDWEELIRRIDSKINHMNW